MLHSLPGSRPSGAHLFPSLLPAYLVGGMVVGGGEVLHKHRHLPGRQPHVKVRHQPVPQHRGAHHLRTGLMGLGRLLLWAWG